MDEQHKEMIVSFFESAQMALPEQKQIPLTFMLIKDNSIIPVMAPDVPKEVISEILGEILRNTDADAIFCICEAWLLMKDESKNLDANRDNYLDGYNSVSEHPDSVECLILSYMDAYGKHPALIRGKIKKDIKGTPYVPDYEIIEDMNDARIRFFSPWKGENSFNWGSSSQNGKIGNA